MSDTQLIEPEIQKFLKNGSAALEYYPSHEDTLNQLSAESQTHLLEEFTDYAVSHPKE